jgi:hypothetical protein
VISFHESSYECDAIETCLNTVLFSFLQSVNATWRQLELLNVERDSYFRVTKCCIAYQIEKLVTFFAVMFRIGQSKEMMTV